MEGKICSSCKRRVVNDKGSVSFKCPKCNQFEIVRCTNCRSNATQYTCANCEFVGPN
jgi:Zn-ribbon RNA-binding protein